MRAKGGNQSGAWDIKYNSFGNCEAMMLNKLAVSPDFLLCDSAVGIYSLMTLASYSEPSDDCSGFLKIACAFPRQSCVFAHSL